MRWLWIMIVAGACAMTACTDMSSHVRSRAARDFACSQEQTHIEDAEAGVYRVSGCGLVAGYQCVDGRSLAVHCDRLYVSKVPAATEPKPGTSARPAGPAPTE
jgi:hypothetical protein